MRKPTCLRIFSLLACLGLVALPAGAQGIGSLITYPHIAHGDQGNGVWRTTFIFVNNSRSTATGFLRMFGDSGEDLVLGTNRGTDNRFDISIPARGQFEIETDGSGSLITGWAVAEFDRAVVGSAVFALNTADGTVVSVGVLDAPPFSAFVAPAEARTGIALANPFNVTQTLEMQARNANGSLVASRELVLSPGNHTALIARDFFSGLSADFVGSVRIRSSNSFFSALAIGFVPNQLFDVGFAVAAMGYDELSTGYSGNFDGTAGSGTLTVSGLQHLYPTMLTGDLSVNNQTLGQTFNGLFFGSVDNFGAVYSFWLDLGLGDRGLAIAELMNGSFFGTVVDDGSGNSATFLIDPQGGSSSGSFLRLPGAAPTRPPKNTLKYWGQ